MSTSPLTRPRTIAVAAVVVVLLVLPSFTDGFFLTFTMTRVLMLGLAASTLIFLSSSVGLVSMAQWLLFGIAGFTFGNVVATSGKGLTLGWPPWLGVVLAIVVATAVAMVLGALSSRTVGIYFLMLTLTYAVIGFLFFGQVTTFSGSGGVTGLGPPPLLDGPVRLYYAALVLSVLAYLGFRALSATPFGLALQGVRDEPVRMSALGFNVPLLRVAAFAVAGFVASLAGLLNVWWNGQIDPNSIGLGPTLELLIIAVVGGLGYLEGAWLGAFVYLSANLYLRDIPGLGDLDGPFFGRILAEERFNTVVGLVLLLVMVASPDGLVGIIERIARRPEVERAENGSVAEGDAASSPRAKLALGTEKGEQS
ncbi:MAG: branched-chain amino acid ABC transporter permease [Actinomycetota bacterium]